MAKVLLIGNGGREAALAWTLAKSEQVEKIYVAPGNIGVDMLIEKVTSVSIGGTSLCPYPNTTLVALAKQFNIDLVVVGPEQALAESIVDSFRMAGIPVVGPTCDVARIEASKRYAKYCMSVAGIPTARYTHHDCVHSAMRALKTANYPVVVKANGLASGKGVVICSSYEEAVIACEIVSMQKGGSKILIEEYLDGDELSVHCLVSGNSVQILPFARDYKRLGDNDGGPNTGGMGCIAPVAIAEKEASLIVTGIVDPLLGYLTEQGTPFNGCLYPGLMLMPDGPKVLEFNARFGDPETEVLMRLLKSDLYEALMAVAREEEIPAIEWYDGYAVCVTLAAPGYPDKPRCGGHIRGIQEASQIPNVVVFPAGVEGDVHGNLLVAGGRVLHVTATGQTIAAARESVYAAVDRITFEGMQYRKDIGLDVI